MRLFRLLVAASLLLPSFGLSQTSTVVLEENSFPTVDTAPLASASLHAGFREARFVRAAELDAALASQQTRLLVLPYGSAYPESAWPAMLRYLERGGNLLVLGGRPFLRAAYRDANGWQLRAESVAAPLELFIQDYQPTPSSDGLTFRTNDEAHVALPALQWKRAFSPVIRLSTLPLNKAELGSAGSLDAVLTPLAWGETASHKLAAPLLLIDHTQHRFVGSRWIFASCDAAPSSLGNPALLSALQALALRANDRIRLQPRYAVFLPGEPLEMRLESVRALQPSDTLQLAVRAEGASPLALTLPAKSAFTLPAAAASGRGLHTIEATLQRNGVALWTTHTGFWMRDLTLLNSGPRLTAGSDYFQLDGQPLPVVGTTYMGSDVNRLYLSQPNPWIWDRDLAQIRTAGLNMIRTGIWSGWSQLTQPDGSMTEAALRSVEALLLTARAHQLPVQFNLFAFTPENLGGDNPYLDPVALTAQDHYLRSFFERFHSVPYLAWDLINEPSPNKNYWRTLPQGDANEKAAWMHWIDARYPDKAALLAAWREPSYGIGRALQARPDGVSADRAAQDPFALPDAAAFEPDAIRGGVNPLKNYDFALFTQEYFAHWVEHHHHALQSFGSTQLLTVGQDEGGYAGRVSPAFFGQNVDFTANHTWWDYDAILWASLAAKLPGKPMLIQEMGSQRRVLPDARLRLSAEDEGFQLERKLAASFAQGAGGIEWVWNGNATMANDNETPIGAVRPDGTEKPEAQVLARFAHFVATQPGRYTQIEPPAVTVVTSQAALYSTLGGLAYTAQKRAVRVLSYTDHTPARLLPENHLDQLGAPKLVLLPAPQALTRTAWAQLLSYVEAGGTLLITGPAHRDEYWLPVDRSAALGLQAAAEPLALRASTLQLPGAPSLEVNYPAAIQQSAAERLRLANGASVAQIHHGKGRILWAAEPLELAEESAPAAALYAWALAEAGVAPAFRQNVPLSSAVLAFPTLLPTAVLYSFSNESATAQPVDITDALSGGRIHLTLGAQRGALLLLDRASGQVLANTLAEETRK